MSCASAELSPGSFRDPGGRLFHSEGRVFRVVYEDALPYLRRYLDSRFEQTFLAEKKLVSTRPLASEDVPAFGDSLPSGSCVVEHERIAFPSYPYEWAPEMLHAAGELTLSLAEAALAEGMGLKDATPFNVLFRHASPVFVDVLSFEERIPGDPVWLAQGQFVRTFLLPLLANRSLAVSLSEVFLAHRDGLEPEQLYSWAGYLQRLHPAFLELCSIPTWLSSAANRQGPRMYEPTRLRNLEKAEYILRCVLDRARRLLNGVSPKKRTSIWSRYMETQSHYSDADLAVKSAFVDQAVRGSTNCRVLALGCNTGRFCMVAARAGADVVAVDSDAVAIGRLWGAVRAENLPVLPLVVDITRPTPATGWCNHECLSFLERARGQFDVVTALALIHHLLVSERIPLRDIMKLFAELTRDAVVVEFVPKNDPMFRLLLRGRDALHADYSEEAFETVCQEYFRILKKTTLTDSGRTLYLLSKVIA